MVKELKIIILTITMFSYTLIYGQTKKEIVVPFDLNKRTLGDLPFDEFFKLSGFSTEYDKITLVYSIHKDFKNKKPNYNNGGKVDVKINKLTKTTEPISIKPLHPNVKYDFVFSVWKEIELNEDKFKLFKAEIYKIIKRDFSDPNNLTTSVKNKFKIDLQKILIKYAGTNKIVDKNFKAIDVTNSKLFKTDISGVIDEYEDKYNEVFSTSDPNSTVSLASKTKSSIARQLNSYDFKTLHNIIIKFLKNNKKNSSSFKFILDSPINISLTLNNKLTLRQYLEYLKFDPTSKIWDVIKGKQKIVGADHLDSSDKVDLVSLNILYKVFEKLERKSITNNKGKRIFSNNQQKFLNTLKTDILTYMGYTEIMNRYKKDISAIESKIPNLLENALITEEILISDSIKIDVLSEKNAYIGLDAGIGYAYGNFNSVFVYQGANIYLRPVNHQAKFSNLQGTDEFLKRFSIYLGINQLITEEDDLFEPLLGSSSLLVGVGYRFHHGIRGNLGTMLHYKKNRIPIVEDKRIYFSPTLSISIDLNIAKALGSVGGILNLK